MAACEPKLHLWVRKSRAPPGDGAPDQAPSDLFPLPATTVQWFEGSRQAHRQCRSPRLRAGFERSKRQSRVRGAVREERFRPCVPPPDHSKSRHDQSTPNKGADASPCTDGLSWTDPQVRCRITIKVAGPQNAVPSTYSEFHDAVYQ